MTQPEIMKPSTPARQWSLSLLLASYGHKLVEEKWEGGREGVLNMEEAWWEAG